MGGLWVKLGKRRWFHKYPNFTIEGIQRALDRDTCPAVKQGSKDNTVGPQLYQHLYVS